jgi:metal-sulfur cluster biosynthetic enzyme
MAAYGKAVMVTEKDVRRALRKVKDPELNLDLVVLGLVYEIDVQDTHVKTKISLTSPFCPVAGQIIDEVKAAVEGVDGVESAEVELTFSPPWTADRIDPLIRATLGL